MRRLLLSCTVTSLKDSKHICFRCEQHQASEGLKCGSEDDTRNQIESGPQQLI